MSLRANGIKQRFGSLRRQPSIHQARGELDRENPPNGLVDSSLLDLAGLHLGQHILVQRLPVLRHHHHIDSRIDRLSTIVWPTATHLTNAIPIAHHETVKTQLVAQNICEQLTVTVNLVAIPAVE